MNTTHLYTPGRSEDYLDSVNVGLAGDVLHTSGEASLESCHCPHKVREEEARRAAEAARREALINDLEARLQKEIAAAVCRAGPRDRPYARCTL